MTPGIRHLEATSKCHMIHHNRKEPFKEGLQVSNCTKAQDFPSQDKGRGQVVTGGGRGTGQVLTGGGRGNVGNLVHTI